MATWIGHLHMANTLLEAGFSGDPDAFLVGSVAPDTGFPEAFLGDYHPPKSITHCYDTSGQSQPEDFFARYLDGQDVREPRRSFLLGYYLHLIADIHWHEIIWTPRFRQPEFAYRSEHEPDFFEFAYQDADGWDFLYLHDHPECIYYTRFRRIESVPDYLDILPAGALTTHLRRLRQRLENPT